MVIKRMLNRISSFYFKARSNILVDRIKRNYRPEFQSIDWWSNGYADLTPSIKDQALSAMHEFEEQGHSNLDRVHTRSLSIARFIEEYDEPGRPLVIDGLTDSWASLHTWTPEALSTGPYRNLRVKCSQTRAGARIPLRDFIHYMGHNRDDSPLYVFDPSFGELAAGRMLLDYAVPSYFAAPDLLALLPEQDRPPHRWLLVGPRRSGSAMHVDPHGTSAWNSLLSGLKLWIFLPPSPPRPAPPRPTAAAAPPPAPESVRWFHAAALPRMRRRAPPPPPPHTLPRPPRGGAARGGGMLAHVQRPGETLFVPAGWRHAVLNLDDSVAVTHNLCSAANLPAVWRSLRAAAPAAAAAWQPRLAARHPPLAALVAAADAADAAAAASAGARQAVTPARAA
jgi:histone arginine demethylase JMJD6